MTAEATTGADGPVRPAPAPLTSAPATPGPAPETAPLTAPRGLRWLMPLYLTLVIGGAALAVVLDAVNHRLRAHELLVLAVLTVSATTYDVVARRIERVRRLTSVGPYVTMTSVWTFAACILLPVWLAAVLAAVLNVEEEIWARRAGIPKPAYRIAFNVAAIVWPTVVVGPMVAWDSLLAGIGPSVATAAWLVLAVVLYGGVNTALVAGVISIAQRDPRALRTALGSVNENILEFATLALGALLAVAVSLDVWLIVLVVPTLVLLQRIALVEHLESAASEDGKTGLLNAATWTHVAERELLRVSARSGSATVMLVDLDHFKRVNDTWGHLSGDAVLRAVADCMSSVLRDRDLLSRFGGEEFVAWLPDADVTEARRIAERLRRRIEGVVVAHVGDGSATPEPTGISVTVSIGLASFPRHGEDLTSLLARADAALYDAKRDGRNRVNTAT